MEFGKLEKLALVILALLVVVLVWVLVGTP